MWKGIGSSLNAGYILFCSILLCSAVLCSPVRNRRQSSPKYIIDTLLVVDDAMYQSFSKWMAESPALRGTNQNIASKLNEYVSLVVHQANDRFATLSRNLGYYISLQIIGIISNVNILGNASKDKTGEVQSAEALDLFHRWLLNVTNKYDHAILMTGHSLASDYTQTGEITKGRAYFGAMCDQQGNSASVVQDNGGFQSVLFLVHEVLHGLGSNHDSVSIGCPPDRYIMTAEITPNKTAENADHPWYFSTCSASAIDSFIKQLTSSVRVTNLPPDCLTSSLNPIPEFTSTSEIVSGQLYTADTQCQMINGNGSRVCLGDGFSDLDEICVSMYCLTAKKLDSESGCIEYVAAEGTSCGDRKWCRLGHCVYSDSAPAMDVTTCPNGDSVNKINDMDCATAIRDYPQFCYTTDVRTKTCCSSCEQIRRNNDECPYGDRLEDCSKDSCGSSSDYKQQCCGTCSQYSPSKIDDVNTIDGVTCEIRVTKDGKQGCYNATVANSCPRTCSKYSKSIVGCEYGDKLLDSTCSEVQTNKTLCKSRENDCCNSCSGGVALVQSTAVLFSAAIVSCTCITLMLN